MRPKLPEVGNGNSTPINYIDGYNQFLEQLDKNDKIINTIFADQRALSNANYNNWKANNTAKVLVGLQTGAIPDLSAVDPATVDTATLVDFLTEKKDREEKNRIARERNKLYGKSNSVAQQKFNDALTKEKTAKNDIKEASMFAGQIRKAEKLAKEQGKIFDGLANIDQAIQENQAAGNMEAVKQYSIARDLYLNSKKKFGTSKTSTSSKDYIYDIKSIPTDENTYKSGIDIAQGLQTKDPLTVSRSITEAERVFPKETKTYKYNTEKQGIKAIDDIVKTVSKKRASKEDGWKIVSDTLTDFKEVKRHAIKILNKKRREAEKNKDKETLEKIKIAENYIRKFYVKDKMDGESVLAIVQDRLNKSILPSNITDTLQKPIKLPR